MNDNNYIAEAHLLMGLLFGVLFFLMGLIFGIVHGDWLNNLQTGLMMGGAVMLCGLILSWVTKLDVFRDLHAK